MKLHFSDKITIFQGLRTPEPNIMLAGYSAIIQVYGLVVPLPDNLCGISHKHQLYDKNQWRMFTPRHAPKSTLYGHLCFAIKYEGFDLSTLKALFSVLPAQEMIAMVKQEPSGAYSRKLWFIYEWLQHEPLDLPDAHAGNYVDLLDPEIQYPGPTRLSKRHRIRNNLPGTPAFCPLIHVTDKIEAFRSKPLKQEAKEVFKHVHPDLIRRASAFLLLEDSKASYAIEGETPANTRAQRWARAIGQAGLSSLSLDELMRLQEIVIDDFRFIQPGLRNAGGFIGTHDRVTHDPIPVHLSADYPDLPELIDGLIAMDELLKESDFDEILNATMIAFGFVFIHPFDDGNGRIHRYLIHHVLAQTGFCKKGIAFPISSVILDRLNEYRETLEHFSKRRLDCIQWRPSGSGNVEILNDTKALYQYFNATKQAEFLYDCMAETIYEILPKEVIYLKNHDAFTQYLNLHYELPNRLKELLIQFLNQGEGRLSKRARHKEFIELTQEEIEDIENQYQTIFKTKIK